MSELFECDFKVLNQSMVGPPLGSVPPTSLPLTFLDIPYIFAYPMQRIFIYDFPYSTNHFLHTFLPSLKNSLSLALSHFFPFSAHLIYSPPPLIPHLLYNDSNHNSVSFTVVESNVDFSDLITFHSQPVQKLHPFMPELPSAHVMDDGTRVVPLMAIQVTILPHSGFVIGVTFHHVVADGKSFHHFMKTWASICRTGKWLDDEVSKPYYNREELRRTWNEQMELKILQEWEAQSEKSKEPTVPADMVRATVVLGQDQIHKLKNWVLVRLQDQEVDTPYVSSFTVTCGLIWTCLVKSEIEESKIKNSDDDKICCFLLMIDCRSQIGIPSTYFGNCLKSGIVRLERKELVMGYSGITEAVKAIGKKIIEIRKQGFVRDAKRWIEERKQEAARRTNNIVIVAGSPKFDAYETDFGLGKPKKSEMRHVEKGGVILMGDSRDENGGIEIGLALPKLQMDNFQSILKHTLLVYGAQDGETNNHI